MGAYSVPESVRKMKPKGSMVKCIHEKYYVYEFFNRKNDDGKWSTKMGKLLGHIDELNGFIPNGFQTLDEMNDKEFNLMMQNGLSDAKEGNSRAVKSVFDDLRKEIAE